MASSDVPAEVHRDRIRSLLRKMHAGEVLLPEDEEFLEEAEHDEERDDDQAEAFHQVQHSREAIS